MRVNDFRLTEHFSLIEFQCPCCHTARLSPKLVMKLEALRISYGRPIVINSGYRCREHNRAVGGAAGSLHRLGCAADVRVAASDMELFRRLAVSAGFSRVILYESRNFVHLECGEAA
ncbi:MAG: D-Ala-D-Ala carboxypeptidase family metallohydrolase [Synergistaceae bacterium]